MKKLTILFLFALSSIAYSADNFNTLDAAPSVSVGAGTNVIGKVGIDQTTPGTTNAVSATQSGTWTVQPGNTANTTPWLVGGNVASGATDSGNPNKIGCVYNSTLPTFTTGQRGDCQVTTNGVLLATPLSSASTPGDGLSNTNVTAPFHAGSGSTVAASRMLPLSVNAAGTWDRIRSGIITPSATLTGLQNSIPWAIYNATPTVRTEGQGGPLQVDTNGALNVVHAASSTGGYAFSNLKANATTTVKSGTGRLHSITINTKGITNTITVYDNTAGSGTTIATIDTTLSQETLTFDLAFTTGLTVVIAGGTAADITITYK